MLDTFNWNDIRYFLAVARTGRLQTAAKKLNVNHTTVARRLAALDAAINAQLFESDSAGYHLTAIGEMLLPLAQKMEDTAQHSRELISSSNNSLLGHFRIGAPDGFGNTFLTSLLTEFLTAHKDITIELTPVPISLNLSRREVDLAITIDPSTRANIHNTKITDYDLLIYTSKEYISRSGFSIDDDANLHTHTFSEYITDLLFSDQLSFNKTIDTQIESRFRSSTVLAQLEFIVGGGGIGVLPYYLAKKHPNLIPVLTDKFKMTRTYWLLTPYDLRRLASVRAFERYLLLKAVECESEFTCE